MSQVAVLNGSSQGGLRWRGPGKGVYGFFTAFGGAANPAEKLAEPIIVNIPMQVRVEAGSNGDIAERTQILAPTDALTPQPVKITINRICRTILTPCLGFWGGWSFFPVERKMPLTLPWVFFICIVTNVVVLTSVLDSLEPSSMEWFFRTHYGPSFLVEKRGPLVKVTGYRIFYTVLCVGAGIWKATASYRGETNTPTNIELGFGVIISVILYWVGKLESAEPPVMVWFFHQDYGHILLPILTTIVAIVSWWWIAFRICAINIVLRKRCNQDIKAGFIVLNIGLACEFFLLLVYFLIPCLRSSGDDTRAIIWRSHRVTLASIVILYLTTLLVGYFPNIFPNVFMPFFHELWHS